MSSTTSSIQFDKEQLEGIKLACDADQRIVGITGAAGTGKTVILREVYNNFANAGYPVALAAPTGKAAKRIREVTGLPATTIHKLLEYTQPRELINENTGARAEYSYPRRDRQKPLDQKVFLIDEYSMVNRELHANLIAAIPAGGLIRAFGDNHQLPPIEEKKYDGQNSPFTVLLQKFSSVVLQTIHRQGEGSGIITASQQILGGRAPVNNDEFNIRFTDAPVGELTTLLAETDGAFAKLDSQILVPMNKTKIGTTALNVLAQQFLYPNKRDYFELERFTKYGEKKKPPPLRVAVGDKVIITKNCAELDIFNGETGIILDYDAAEMMTIDLGDRTVVIPPALQVQVAEGDVREVHPHKSIDLAYVITTHKAQGSEYDQVAYVLNRATGFMQNRRNFYTAVTRGRRKVTVITDRISLSNSVFKKGD